LSRQSFLVAAWTRIKNRKIAQELLEIVFSPAIGQVLSGLALIDFQLQDPYVALVTPPGLHGAPSPACLFKLNKAARLVSLTA
jgi:hypothetical protein